MVISQMRFFLIATSLFLTLFSGPLMAQEASTQAPDNLIIAILEGNVTKVTGFLDANVSADAVDGDGNSLLHIATSAGQGAVVTLLINRSANVSATTPAGLTPLHFAAASDRADIATALMNAGASHSATDIGGLSPLHYSALQAHLSTARRLVTAGANVNANSAYLGTPLNISIKGIHRVNVNFSQFLIQSGANVNTPNPQGLAPVLSAIAASDNDTIFLRQFDLLVAAQADFSVTDRSGAGVLHYALRTGGVNLPSLFAISFKQSGTNVNQVENLLHETPLHLAVKMNRPDLVRMLLRAGADVDLKTNYNKTALELAQGAASPNSSIIDLLKASAIEKVFDYAQNGNVLKLRQLLVGGFNVNTQNEHGEGLLHIAAVYDKVEVVRLLLDNSANVDLSANGYTPLHYAIWGQSSGIVRLLIDSSATMTTTVGGRNYVQFAQWVGAPASIITMLRNAMPAENPPA